MDGRSDDRSGLAAEYQQATATHKQATERVATPESGTKANSEVAALRARAEALEEQLRRGVDATAAVLANPESSPACGARSPGQLVVAEGFETAIAAALGAAAEAITVGGLDAAVSVLTRDPRGRRRNRGPRHRGSCTRRGTYSPVDRLALPDGGAVGS